MTRILPAEFRVLLRGPLGRFYLAAFVMAIGFGLSLILTVVYVHDVRHHSIAFASGLLAMNAIVGISISPLIGTATDRFGPIRVFMTLAVVQVGALIMWGYSSSIPAMVLASVGMAIGAGAFWGPSTVLLTRCVPPEWRQQAFGTNFGLFNLGLGLGGLVSAVVVDVHKAYTFRDLYIGTAAFMVLSMIPYLTLRSLGGPASEAELSDELKKEGWREVLRDHRLIRYIAGGVILLSCGYGSLDAGYSLYVVDVVKLVVGFVGVTLFFNTVTIVLGQLFTLRFIEGRSRTKVMGVVSVIWALSWVIIGLAAHLGHNVALAVLCLASMIFAAGETFWSPVGPAMVNDLAPEHLRGRYNSASSLVWSLSSAFAPIVAGGFLSSSNAQFWPFAVGGGALIGGSILYRLGRSLTPAQDGLARAEVSEG